jgi:hypothetical protein
MPKVCAFVRADGMCSAPPASWPKQLRRLHQLQSAGSQGQLVRNRGVAHRPSGSDD